MATSKHKSKKVLDRVLGGRTPSQLAEVLRSKSPDQFPLPEKIPTDLQYSMAAMQERWELLKKQGVKLFHLTGQWEPLTPEQLKGNIENLIGFARIPVGVMGPLRINGSAAQGDFYVPLATTEGALVASYHRGATVISAAGGATTLCLTESVARAPCFVFRDLIQAGLFLSWMVPRVDELHDVVSKTSRYAHLADMRTSVIGREVFLIFEFTTGDAAGQNMVTVATEAICQYLILHAPVKPERWYVEANFSGDKKATMMSFLYARGKKVVSEVIIPKPVVHRLLHTEPEEMMKYWATSVMGGIQSGSIGVQGHFANALAALFLACGQDVACVSEASVGITRMDVTHEGSLYVSVSLPNVIVGAVGGGTLLPTAQECLEMIGCVGEGRARKFAEICAATVLAGEISIIAALTSGDFSHAHATLGRKKAPPSR